MACHELAALRLGLMNIIGIDDAAEREHERQEIGSELQKPGPIRQLAEAQTLSSLARSYQLSLAGLEEKVAKLGPDAAEMPYYRALLVATKKVEMGLRQHSESLRAFYSDLDELHDYIHEIYPS